MISIWSSSRFASNKFISTRSGNRLLRRQSFSQALESRLSRNISWPLERRLYFGAPLASRFGLHFWLLTANSRLARFVSARIGHWTLSNIPSDIFICRYCDKCSHFQALKWNVIAISSWWKQLSSPPRYHLFTRHQSKRIHFSITEEKNYSSQAIFKRLCAKSSGSEAQNYAWIYFIKTALLIRLKPIERAYTFAPCFDSGERRRRRRRREKKSPPRNID